MKQYSCVRRKLEERGWGQHRAGEVLQDWNCRLLVHTLGVNATFDIACTTISELRDDILFYKSIQKVYDY